MHGTWINCKKIAANKDVPIRSGDVVIFGTEVIRGEGMPSTSIVIPCQTLSDSLLSLDTYPPMRVRCECQWFDLEYVATCFTSSRGSFTNIVTLAARGLRKPKNHRIT